MQFRNGAVHEAGRNSRRYHRSGTIRDGFYHFPIGQESFGLKILRDKEHLHFMQTHPLSLRNSHSRQIDTLTRLDDSDIIVGC